MALSSLRSAVSRYPIQSAATAALLVLLVVAAFPDLTVFAALAWGIEHVGRPSDVALVALAFALGVWLIPAVEWLSRRFRS